MTLADMQSLWETWRSAFLPFTTWIGELRKPQVLRADILVERFQSTRIDANS